VFKITADALRFDEAIEWFRARLPITDDEFDILSAEARQRAWTIAGVEQLDVVQSVWSEIDKANTAGTPFEDFKKSIEPLLTEEWGQRNSPRVETIFRNATQASLNRGRYAQMTDPEVVRFRPFWMYDAVRDARTTTLCAGLDKTVLPQDLPFWDTHIPPLHHRCRAGIRSLRKSEAEKRGISRVAPAIEPDPGFGHAPGKGEWKPVDRKYAEGIRRASKLRKERNSKPAGSIVEGKHFKKFSSRGVTPAEQSKILEAARKARLVDFLEKRPLSELFLAPRVSDEYGVLGAYWPALQRLGVRTKLPPGSLGQVFEPGKSFAVSLAGTDKVDSMRRTFVHELGHHVHRTSEQADKIIQAAFFNVKSPITEYAGVNRAEYFAESFAAYTFHRGALRKHDPVGYRMVREVLTLQGIPL